MSRFALGKTVWDNVLGRRLYDEGRTYHEIASIVGTVRVNVRLHARRQWPARDEPPADRPRSAKPPRGRMLLRAGESSLPRLACLDDG